jgi:hypothetical protein
MHRHGTVCVAVPLCSRDREVLGSSLVTDTGLSWLPIVPLGQMQAAAPLMGHDHFLPDS